MVTGFAPHDQPDTGGSGVAQRHRCAGIRFQRVPDWRERLVCSRCGSRVIDMVVTGTERHAID
jgi:hypothetical protein